MKRIHWVFAVAVTAFALSLNVVAQPPGGGMGPPGGMPPGGGPPFGGMGGGGGPGGMGPMGPMGPGGAGGIAALFQNPEFAKELELSSEQSTQLQTVVRESGEAMRSRFQEAMANRDPNAGPPSQEEMRRFSQFMESGMTEAQGKVDRVLRPEQRTKLSDMSFQLSGGLTSPMMGAITLRTLELTDTQKEQLRKLTEERPRLNPADYELRSAEGRAKFQADMEANNAKFAEQVKGILTPEQKAKAEKLTAAAPELRKKLGIPEPGQPPQRGPQRPGQPPAPGGGFVPGQGAWQPGGQNPPNAPAPPPGGQQRRGGFPRGEN